jgi:hypothetical protein
MIIVLRTAAPGGAAFFHKEGVREAGKNPPDHIPDWPSVPKSRTRLC